jgi:hypothetical protein
MNTVPRHAKKDKKEELTGKQKFRELFSTFQEFKRPDLGLHKNVISRFRNEKKHFKKKILKNFRPENLHDCAHRLFKPIYSL